MSIGTLADGVWALPGAVVSATEELFSGDILGALETLATAVVDPIVQAAGGLVAVLGGGGRERLGKPEERRTGGADSPP